MSTSFSRILTCYLIQSYLLKTLFFIKYLLSLHRWCFPGKFTIFLKQHKHQGVLKNFAIFTGKHLCWSLNLIKLRPSGSCLRDCNFVKKRLQHRCFSVNIATFLWNIYSEEHLRKEFCRYQHSFTANQQILLYQEIQI